MKIYVKKDNIYTTLAQKGKNLKWLSKRCEISYSYMTKLYRGEKSISSKVSYKILHALNGRNRDWDMLFEIRSMKKWWQHALEKICQKIKYLKFI